MSESTPEPRVLVQEMGLREDYEPALIAKLDPSRTAVLGLHWSENLRRQASPLGKRVMADATLIPRIRSVYAAARKAGVLVIHAQVCNPDNVIANNPLYWHAAQTGRLRCGSPETEVMEPLRPQDEDLVFFHHRASVFYESGLDAMLRYRRIDTLIVSGVTTNLTVESAVRSAIDHGYRVAVLEDCCAAITAERHDNSMATLSLYASEVSTARAFIDAASRCSGEPGAGGRPHSLGEPANT